MNGKRDVNLHAKDELDALVDLYGKEEVLRIWNSIKSKNPDRLINVPLIIGTKGKGINFLKE